jgi:hypothetical protein
VRKVTSSDLRSSFSVDVFCFSDGNETCCLISKEGYKMRMVEEKGLSKTFGPKKMERQKSIIYVLEVLLRAKKSTELRCTRICNMHA